MITKAEEHDIDRAGRRIFSEIMESLNFVANPVTDDYGIDYNVQAFNEKKPTGAWFHVQLKSSAAPSHSADGSFISFPLDLDHLIHYATELTQPIFIVLGDTSLRRLYWFSPQMASAEILEARENGQQSLTLRIPTKQDLPQSAEFLVESLKKTYLLISSRNLIEATLPNFQETLSSLPNQEEMFDSFQKKNDIVRLSRVAADQKAGRIEEAMRRAETLSLDEDASVSARYHAITQLHSLEWSRALHTGVIGPALADSTFRFSRRLRTLANRNDPWIKFSAIFVGALAKLEAMIHQDGADYMTIQQQVHVRAHPLVILGLLVRRTASAKTILAQYVRCYRLARLASVQPDRWAFNRLLTRLPTAIAPYLISLRSTQMDSVESIFVNSCLEVLNLSSSISLEIGDYEGIVLAIMSSVSLGKDESSAGFIWAKAAEARLPDGAAKDAAKETLERVIKRWRGEQQPGDYNPDPIWQIIQKIALAMHIDISDEGSAFVRRLRIAARDNDPERFLRFCENLVITFGSISRIDRTITQVLGIDTSSNKVVHCRKFNLHLESTDGDSAFTQFRKQHCDSCMSRIPRPDDWSHTKAVRTELEKENLAFVRAAFAEGRGMRLTYKDDLE